MLIIIIRIPKINSNPANLKTQTVFDFPWEFELAEFYCSVLGQNTQSCIFAFDSWIDFALSIPRPTQSLLLVCEQFVCFCSSETHCWPVCLMVSVQVVTEMCVSK